MTSEDSLSTEPLPLLIEPTAIKTVLAKRLDTWCIGRGEVCWPCVPALLDEYMRRLEALFAILGKPWSAEELERLRTLLGERLKSGFEASPHSQIVIKFETDGYPVLPCSKLGLSVSTQISTFEDEYKKWTKSRQPPLFGSHPDAKVMQLVTSFQQDTGTVPILDVGAGTGRNTFPLARLGYPVQVLEPVPVFIQQMAVTTQAENLPVMLTRGNILDPKLVLPQAHFQLVIVVEVVSHFRSPAQLRAFLERMAEVTRPGGLLLFNAFLAILEYQPSVLERELSQVMWSCFFTREELEVALVGLPFELVSDECAYEYEKSHLPAEAWPPTGWFEQWATGRDIFPVGNWQPPVGLRWLVYRRLGSNHT